ncbi:MAG: hypothetical protein GF401_12335 [Chitinivibrionales bacterium]|nr:hypothetical protein [Chitinivibrionales bacterium]
MKSTNNFSRREFIKNTAALSALPVITSCSTNPEEKATVPKQSVAIGSGTEEISVIGMGGGAVFFGLSDAEAQSVLEECVNSGINLYDTGPNYHLTRKDGDAYIPFNISEERYGKVLSKHRDKVLISTKTTNRPNANQTAAEQQAVLDAIDTQLDQSLTRLQTTYVDFYSAWNIVGSDDISFMQSTIWQKLVSLKSSGKVRYIGLSGMESATKMKEAIEGLDPKPDFVIIPMTPTGGSLGDGNAKYIEFASVTLPVAKQHNVAVFGMKVMKGLVGEADTNGNPITAEELFNYAHSKGVSSALIGHTTPAEVKGNADLVKNSLSKRMSSTAMKNFEKRLAHLTVPGELVWTRRDYHDGAVV